MEKIEHIGIAVNDLEESIRKYEILLQSPCYKRERVDAEGVETAFFKIGDSKIELLQAIGDQGPIAKFIAKRGEGIHHIAYEVSDIKTEMKRFIDEGFQVLTTEPKRGADEKWVCFIHPKDASGVLTELVQSM